MGLRRVVIGLRSAVVSLALAVVGARVLIYLQSDRLQIPGGVTARLGDYAILASAWDYSLYDGSYRHQSIYRVPRNGPSLTCLICQIRENLRGQKRNKSYHALD